VFSFNSSKMTYGLQPVTQPQEY